jgi:apolipoprotein N-acyltransferase
VAGALAFEPVGWRWLAPVAMALAFDAVQRSRGPGAAFRRMVVFGWIFYFGAIQWLTTIGDYAPAPLLASVGIGALALYMTLYPALGVYALRRWLWRPGPGTQFLLFACVWVLAEWLRTLGRLAVPLAQLGHAWAAWPVAIQPAQFVGEIGISLEILWLAGIFYYWSAYFRARRAGGTERERAAAPDQPSIGRGILPTLFFPVLILACALLLAGWQARINAFADKPEAQSLRVVLVQPNIQQPIKLASYASPYGDVQALLREAIATVLETMLAGQPRPEWDATMAELTGFPLEGDAVARTFQKLEQQVAARQHALPDRPPSLDADLAVLPETAFAEWNFPESPESIARVGRMAQRAGAPLLFGASRTTGAGSREAVYNSAFLMQADGRLSDRFYDKMRLVPFGECLPYFDMIPGFQENIVGVGSFTEGRQRTLFEATGVRTDGTTPTSPLRLGVLICFESTFSSSGRMLAAEGADALIVITNDGWYGASAGARAHHDLSLLRAVENRRYVVRCANTGISSVIAPTGRIVGSVPLNEAGLLHCKITPKTDYGTTLFTRIGNGWLALPIGLLVWAGLANRRSASRHRPD